jgi:hypothetical protein
MPATVRQTLNQTLARQFLADVIGTEKEFYIGIGKSDVFPNAVVDGETIVDYPYLPADGNLEESEFRHNLQSIKKVEGAIIVAKRNNWVSDAIYHEWSDVKNAEEDTAFYVLNDAKEVYVCLETGRDGDGNLVASTVKPSYCELNYDYTRPFRTSDGYVWKFLYKLTPQQIFQYLSSNHVPVSLTGPVSNCDNSAIEDLQMNVINAAVKGEIIRCEVTSKGSGYTTTPTVTVVGDGDGNATAEATMVDGEIVKITMINYGSGYTRASFVLDGTPTTECKTRAVITRHMGNDPVDDLKTSSVMLNIKPDGTEGNTFIVENEFRQIGVLQDPLALDGTPYTEISGKVMSVMHFETDSPFSNGSLIRGQGEYPAEAYVNESVDQYLLYHQNENTGFLPFQLGDVVKEVGSDAEATVTGLTFRQEIDRYSGEVLYIENRYRIIRDAEQQEDIKVVITI